MRVQLGKWVANLSELRPVQFLQRAGASFAGRLFKNSAWGMAGLVILVAAGVLQIGLITRALTVEQYGILTIITVFPTIIQNFAGFRTQDFVARYGTEALTRADPEGAGRLALIGWMLDATVGLSAYLIILFAARSYLSAARR